jgi:hypothetical protein
MSKNGPRVIYPPKKKEPKVLPISKFLRSSKPSTPRPNVLYTTSSPRPNVLYTTSSPRPNIYTTLHLLPMNKTPEQKTSSPVITSNLQRKEPRVIYPPKKKKQLELIPRSDILYTTVHLSPMNKTPEQKTSPPVITSKLITPELENETNYFKYHFNNGGGKNKKQKTKNKKQKTKNKKQ